MEAYSVFYLPASHDLATLTWVPPIPESHLNPATHVPTKGFCVLLVSEDGLHVTSRAEGSCFFQIPSFLNLTF